jgi:ribonuclease BN (tRNA processing enzyme)
MPVLTDGPFTVTAMGVTHGPVPALAYRVDYAGRSIVFSGDQNGDDPQFPAFAHGADVLVMDHAVPEDARGVAANLHALPSEIATIAKQAGVKRLLLSHIMERSQRVLDQSLAIIARGYGGKVEVARDLLCLAP